MEIIKAFNKHGIVTADFEFDCGGDQMNYTELKFYDDTLHEVDAPQDLHDLVEEMIYEKVKFYVDSDGHYIGERGSVMVSIEDDTLVFSKTAEAGYSEEVSVEVGLDINEEVAVLDGCVRSIILSGGETQIEYEKDFVMTDAHENAIEAITQKMNEKHEEVGVYDYPNLQVQLLENPGVLIILFEETIFKPCDE